MIAPVLALLLQATSPPHPPSLASAPVSAALAAALQQQRSPLRIRVEPGKDDAVLGIGAVLDDHELADAARSGLPIRLRFRTELWRDEFIDDLVESVSWSTVVVFEPLSRRFFVRSTAGDQQAHVFASFEAARTAVERDVQLHHNTRREGRYYYYASLDIETLSISDLNELERWLQGDLQPAVQGDQSIPGALGSGAKRLLIRALGMPARHFEARSSRFRIPGAAD